MNKMVTLRTSRRDFEKDERITQTNYVQGAPFFDNPRGVLIHRVKALFRLEATFRDWPWLVVEYWCENSGRTDMTDEGLVFDPGDKLICARCEANAVAHGETTSSELAGRHVCTGVCRPVNTCCRNDQN